MRRAAQISYSAIAVDGSPATMKSFAARLKQRADQLGRFLADKDPDAPEESDTGGEAEPPPVLKLVTDDGC